MTRTTTHTATAGNPLHSTVARLAIAMLLAAGIALAVPASAQEDVAIEEVRTGIYLVTAKGGNVGVLIGEDGTFMIDDKFPEFSEGIQAALESVGGDTPRFLINTHFHGDHTGGNENFGKAGSTIVSHHNVHHRLAEGASIPAFGVEMPPAPGVALPVVTYADHLSFHINGERIDVIHTPDAHTDGDSFVHFTGSNVIHTGDLMFNGFYPFIDTGNGGTVQGMVDAANAMLALADDDTIIIPGHGPLAAKSDLEAYRDMLAEVQDRLGKMKAAGLSAEDIALGKPLQNLEQQWGGGIFSGEKWISIIYDGL